MLGTAELVEEISAGSDKIVKVNKRANVRSFPSLSQLPKREILLLNNLTLFKCRSSTLDKKKETNVLSVK